MGGGEVTSTTKSKFAQTENCGKPDLLPLNNIAAVAGGSRRSSREELQDRIWVDSEIEVTVGNL